MTRTSRVRDALVARSGSFCSAGQCSDDHRTLVDPRTVHPECARLRTIAHCNRLSYHVLRSRRTPSEVGCWSENVVVRAECNTGWRLVPVGDLVLVSMLLFVRRVTLSTDPFAFFIALNFCFRAVFLLWARCESFAQSSSHSLAPCEAWSWPGCHGSYETQHYGVGRARNS